MGLPQKRPKGRKKDQETRKAFEESGHQGGLAGGPQGHRVSRRHSALACLAAGGRMTVVGCQEKGRRLKIRSLVRNKAPSTGPGRNRGSSTRSKWSRPRQARTPGAAGGLGPQGGRHLRGSPRGREVLVESLPGLQGTVTSSEPSSALCNNERRHTPTSSCRFRMKGSSTCGGEQSGARP